MRVRGEINADHPISVSIVWDDTVDQDDAGGHNVTVGGYDDTIPGRFRIEIYDPDENIGYSIQDLSTFPESYEGGARLDRSYFTHK